MGFKNVQKRETREIYLWIVKYFKPTNTIMSLGVCWGLENVGCISL